MKPSEFVDMDEQEKAFIFAAVERKVKEDEKQKKKLDRKRAKKR